MGKDKNSCKDSSTGKISRRGFISSVGAGAAAVTIASKTSLGNETISASGESLLPIVLNINDREFRVQVEPRYTLLYVLRDMLELTGTKTGCERGECGACTVIFDGETRYACKTLAVEAEGHKITTIEGLMVGEEPGPVQKAFMVEGGFQCGFCTPGQIMSVEGLLRKNPDPTYEDVQKGVSGNLCRCAAYKGIFESGLKAAQLKKGGEK